MVQRNQRGYFTLPATTHLELTELPQLKLTMSLGKFCGPNKGSLSLYKRINDPQSAYRFNLTSVGTFPLAHHGDKRGATLPHKPMTPFQMPSLV